MLHNDPTNTIEDAQRDMRRAYAGGADGALTSATAWLVAAIVGSAVELRTGVITLLVGGMSIFPVSVVVGRLMGHSGRHAKDNPLAPLAIQGTIWMLLCIIIAIAVAAHRIDWFFPAMLMIIGGRYLTFATLYGRRIYVIFGATLAGIAVPLVLFRTPAMTGAWAGAFTEYVFGILIWMAERRNSSEEVHPRSNPDA
ncbi:MAG: hypothetical protein AB8G96_07190 [Phycisphaerales bacterium]